MRNYLLDISSVAAMFDGYGHHPLNYIVKLMMPRANNYHTLLGNFAGSALDDIINHKQYDVNDTFRSNFQEKALEYATCRDFDAHRFKQDAIRQARNIQEIVGKLLPPATFRLPLLEPSFICPKLGLQGRVDLMTDDFKLLVEQKSGKQLCPQKHYVQVLLYYAVLAENFGLHPGDTDIRLLYSKFPLPDGLRRIDALANKRLLDEAIALRDDVAAMLFRIADEGFGCVMDMLTPDVLVPESLRDSFFIRYELPRLQAILTPLHRLSPLEQAYFERMMTFVICEQIVAKVGGSTVSTRPSGADMWHMTLKEKREMGSIYTRLTIREMSQSSTYNGYDTLVLDVPDQGADFMPVFRRGDAVSLYTYPEDEEPDATKAILYNGVLTEIAPDHVTIHLRDGQQNAEVFAPQRSTLDALHLKYYAIEPSISESLGAQVRSLYAFITAPQECRDLLLGQRAPRRNTAIQLSQSYHHDYDDILLRIKQAEDYFLLVGPPGTGKTSMALRFIVEEMTSGSTRQLTTDNHHPAVLILSYTNRAVDEICAMLEGAGFDFIRLGSEYSCDPRFRTHLIPPPSTPDSSPLTLASLRHKILDAQIVVSTTSTMSSRSYLLGMKHFSLTIVDEASQILEPNIIGLLAETACPFVLIGDYKQLPAVVQQDKDESSADSPLLHEIHLDNCRNSLFERLIRTERAAGRSDFIGILHKHGRMHPAIAEFPCRHFYPDELLEPVPLPHQSDTDRDRLFMGKRVMFIPSQFCEQTGLSDKVNIDEARTVARLLIGIRKHYGAEFDINTTVGVIVPYRNQIAMIRQCLQEAGAPELQQVTIDTVERYQGSQRDIIIYSFTVQKPYQLEFLTSNTFEENGHTIDRKLNVVMTRARKQLFLIGNKKVLEKNTLYRRLVERYEDRNFTTL